MTWTGKTGGVLWDSLCQNIGWAGPILAVLALIILWTYVMERKFKKQDEFAAIGSIKKIGEILD